MGQALYRKYRSKSLDELVGQEHITHTLTEAIKAGKIAHAYLFTGPRGVGKTSTARILAHAINNLPYGEGETYLDIIEIDAASNNSVEDIRDLREKVYVAPASGKYKVYIIDEVHMLSKAAFNAILKTLEEPPAHAVFILATTESHKLPETIISRTQRYIFRPVAAEVAAKHLRMIADTEKIDISDEALYLLAEHGDGSFRDSISLLDQASGLSKRIEETDIQQLLGIPDSTAIQKLTASVTGTPFALGEAMEQVYTLIGQGFQASAIAHQLSVAIRAQITSGKQAPTHAVVQLLDKLLDVPTKRDPERYLEIVLLTLGSVASPATTQAAAVSTPAIASQHVVSAMPATAKPPKQALPKAPPNETAAPTKQIAPATATTPLKSFDAAIWSQVLDSLKKQYNTLYGIIRLASVQVTDAGELRLGFAFAFHQKRVNEAKNREIIANTLQQITGTSVAVVCVHDPELKTGKPGVTDVAAAAPNSTEPATAAAPQPEKQAQTATAGSLTDISNIFGGGELLQS